MINFYNQSNSKSILKGYEQIELLGFYLFTNKAYLNFPLHLSTLYSFHAMES